MELELCLTSLALLIVLATGGVVPEGHISEDDSLQNRFIVKIGNIQRQLFAVTRSIGALDAEIAQVLAQCRDRPESCSEVYAGQQAKDDGSFLWNQMKRTGTDIPYMAKNKRLYSELSRNHAKINHLMKTVNAAGKALDDIRKRNCNVNLGFHCDTEEMTDFADVYDFLSSPESPGKKRSDRIIF